MPFTAAHPAAVVPLLRRDWPLDRAALVCGAIAPDFEYFLRARLESSFSHTLGGLAFTLPVAILLVFTWELVVREPCVASLPTPLRARAHGGRPPGCSRDARAWVALVVCALIGVLTHLGWDAFTHHRGPGVEWLPTLRRPSGLPGIGGLPWYRVVQHGSTVAGAVILGWHVARLPRAADTGPPDVRLRRSLLLGATLGGATLPWLRHGVPHSLAGLWVVRGNLLVAGLSGGMAGLLIAAFLVAPGGRAAGRVRGCALRSSAPPP